MSFIFIDFVRTFFPAAVELFCLLFKIVILFLLIKSVRYRISNKTIFYLLIILFSGIITNINLLFIILNSSLSQNKFLFSLHRILVRLDCAALGLQFFALLCFFRELSTKKISRRIIGVFFIFSSGFIGFYLFWAFYTSFVGDVLRGSVDNLSIRLFGGYYLFQGLITLIVIVRNYKVETLKLLKQHNVGLAKYFMIPYFLVKIVESDFVLPEPNLMVTSITSMLLTYMVYYCARMLLNLRFLNIQRHVKSNAYKKFNFPNDFVSVISNLGSIAKGEELIPIAKKFFKKAFDIEEKNIHLFLRGKLINEGKSFCYEKNGQRKLYIEEVFNPDTEKPEISNYVAKHKILIRDEIEFTDFYETTENFHPSNDSLREVIHFINHIKADVFLPIYSNNRLVASIVIDKDARGNRLFTDVERDEMLIFCNYLSSIIYLVMHMNLDTILERERNVRLSAYSNKKMLSLLKRSLSPFVDSKGGRIGILNYKNKKFSYLNQEARDLLKADLNKDRGFDITSVITEMAQESAKFLNSYKKILKNQKDEPLLVSVAPNVDKSNTIITVTTPYISDLIKDKLFNLKELSKWEYALALVTTKEGAAIERLLPADTPTLLNCKISFFEYATTQKKLLLEVSSEEDALVFAQAAHKINGREMFEEVVLSRYQEEDELAYKLFGLNPIFEEEHERCLLESLHEKGTLFIQNIHWLSLDLQRKLLEFITTGKFNPLRSDEFVESDVLLICASNQNLMDLVQRGLFLKDFYLELRRSSLWLPSLSSLPEEEFLTLAEGLRQQVVLTKLYQNLLLFSEADKNKLLVSGCVSLQELKTKIKTIVLKKTQRHSIDTGSIIDPAYAISDLDLAEAARLGRLALKDPKILNMLMIKFKHSQSKVAQFLGVNRSSVSRRCIQYEIDTPFDPLGEESNNL
ncbi:sigma 54-interacting transcriptional regulator [Candidatus Babeliales bacterium]|nr:sigma 54-interacting transcriptional regulator [Candidatus Babeliales bacterium]